jgi:hypothetical protein
VTVATPQELLEMEVVNAHVEESALVVEMKVTLPAVLEK